MTPERIIRAFLEKERDDWRVYQRLSAVQLDRLARKHKVDPDVWRRMRRHQKVMFLICLRTRRFALWAATGTGKTFVMLALVNHLRIPVIVLVPRKPNKTEWQREIEKHMPHLPYLVLRGSSRDKWAQIEEHGDDALLMIETYGGMARLVGDLGRDGRKGKSKSKKLRVVPKRGKITKLSRLTSGLVIDESQNCANKKTLPFRISRKLGQTAQLVFALSGTPFGRNVERVWSQMFLVDNGETLGKTLGFFRDVFFSAKDNYWGGREYTFRKQMMPELRRVLNHRSIRIRANEADLPACSMIKKYIQLPTDAETHYKRAWELWKNGRGSIQESKNAFLRLRQISSGFVGYSDDDTGTRAQFAFDENPKLEMLMSLVEGVVDEHKCVIFYEFTWSAARIVEQLKRLKIGYSHLAGRTKRSDQELLSFVNDDRRRVMLLQNLFGAGLNIQIAKYGFFYESPVSSTVRAQCEGRIRRQGSAHEHVFLYDLVTTDTNDEKVLEFVREGQEQMHAILDGDQAPRRSQSSIARRRLSRSPDNA